MLGKGRPLPPPRKQGHAATRRHDHGGGKGRACPLTVLPSYPLLLPHAGPLMGGGDSALGNRKIKITLDNDMGESVV